MIGSQRPEPAMYSFACGSNCHRRNLVRFNLFFHPPKPHLEGGNYHADNLFSNCLHMAVILILNMFTDNVVDTSRVWSC